MNELASMDFEGKYLILKEEALQPEYRDLTWRTVKVIGGFGTNPSALGRAIFVEFVRDGDTSRYERQHFERVATDDEVEAARKAGA